MHTKKLKIFFGVALSGAVRDEEEKFPLFDEIQLIVRLIENAGMENLLPQLKNNYNLRTLRQWMKDNLFKDKPSDELKVKIAEFSYSKLNVADAAIFEGSVSSWGPGQEFGHLFLRRVPILYVVQKDSLHSSVMPSILKSRSHPQRELSSFSAYEDTAELEKIVHDYLSKLSKAFA